MTDALTALEAARERYELAYDAFEDHIRLARLAGHSWAEIAVATGSDFRQTAHRRWRHLDAVGAREKGSEPRSDLDDGLFSGLGEV